MQYNSAADPRGSVVCGDVLMFRSGKERGRGTRDNTSLDALNITSITMTQSKEDKINQAQSNLPLPEQPPVASDWQSADARNVNVGAGGVSSDISTGNASSTGLREPATVGSGADMSSIGRQGKDGLEGPPKDASAR
ncbi:hypothetical protein NKR23_g872 [Pleurostoma richardsiae]|uniref:Uncharacterized protein n=1 Tax=Pleurostoma richardsiae TaxID=41990 RepID=A0AA38S568_9PEZI|nr:hypothetical protein NKR23_g872 [Pleurostoma richardsiae]